MPDASSTCYRLFLRKIHQQILEHMIITLGAEFSKLFKPELRIAYSILTLSDRPHTSSEQVNMNMFMCAFWGHVFLCVLMNMCFHELSIKCTGCTPVCMCKNTFDCTSPKQFMLALLFSGLADQNPEVSPWPPGFCLFQSHPSLFSSLSISHM